MDNKVVYAWLNAGIPFYIGIGTIKRSRTRSGRNSHCKRKRAKAERENCFEIRLLHVNLSKEQACQLEQSYISLYGRIDNGTGILTNMSDGGEVQTGKIISKEQRALLSSIHKGRKRDRKVVEQIAKNRTGSRNTPETLELMRENSANARSITTPFGEFRSQEQASREIGKSVPTIRKYCKSDDYPGYYYNTTNRLLPIPEQL